MSSSSAPAPAKVCVNGLCGATTTTQWKRGWSMKAGGFATLCYTCGTAYEKINYCEKFHLNEPGWRECKFCNKPIHCGCIVSRHIHEYLELGGITCVKCSRSQSTQPLKQPILNDTPNGFARFSGSWRPPVFNNRMNNASTFETGKLTHLTKALEKPQQPLLTPSIGHHFRQEENRLSSSKDSGALVPHISPLSVIPHNSRPNLGPKAAHEPRAQQSFGFSLGTGTSRSSSILPISNAPLEGSRVQEKNPALKLQKPRLMFPKPSKLGVNIRVSDNRVARPPAEGRGRGHLLPRYWPKITDQELLQISGDLNSNCTITPLFEKVLSASDAGRIGRLVLPKACAETYFPPINQSEGLPIKIRDMKGKEWTFQFRFWPNNNSRMYVLEGVTPCIQNMQMQAGDTVIFSRIDPEDKLLIGCRKATISAEEKAETSALPSTASDGTPISTGNENPPTQKNIENENATTGNPLQRPAIQDKKKMRNIGSKNKRLHMCNDEAMELKLTWQETQDFFRPPPSEPTVTTIENCEIEEYDEPPAFGKKTIFTMTAKGLQEQWVQCDNCSKRRKLPSDFLVPPKWTCSDNVSDPERCSCSAPEERKVGDLDQILSFSKGSKKRKHAESRVTVEPQPEPSGLEALATAAVLGESGGTTTKHPRHRPGCTCIVCIQPPSGKGKHKPNCICNVCLTVKRRFKTLTKRKSKRLPEPETSVQKSPPEPGDGIGIGFRQEETARKSVVPLVGEAGSGNRTGTGIGIGNSKGQELDLNCDPKEEEMMIEWQNMLARLVPKGKSEINKVVGGS